MRTALLAALVLGAVASNVAGQHPVQKVIKLLEDMKSTLEAEDGNDEEVYNKFACWCNVNEAEKTKSIAESEAKIQELHNLSTMADAKVQRLSKEIAQLEEELEEAHAALKAAMENRAKEADEFAAKNKDLLDGIRALKSCVTILKKHQNPSLLSMQSALRAGMSTFRMSERDESLVNTILAQQAEEPDYWGAKPIGDGAYASQSGRIFGIMQQMQEDMEKDAGEAFAEEKAKIKAFEEYKAAQEKLIEETQNSIANKGQERAELQRAAANAKEDIKATKESLSADQAYLMDLQSRCQQTDKLFNERKVARADEMQAVSEALGVLQNDKADMAFSNSFNSDRQGEAFLQMSSVQKARRTQAAKVLQAAAMDLKNPKLAMIASKVRRDNFTKVKAAIDDMIAELKKERKDEVEHKDFCIAAIAKNEKETTLNDNSISDLNALIEKLTTHSAQLGEELEELAANIAETKTQMKRAGDNRARENIEFQKNSKDQAIAMDMLQRAFKIIEEQYNKNSLLQQEPEKKEPVGPPPPEGFGAYKQQDKKAGGVLGLMKQIIGDVSKEAAELQAEETDSQQAYESFIKDGNNSVTAMQEETVQKTAERAETDENKNAADKELEDAEQTKDDLSAESTDLHGSCDFYLKNFDMRQGAFTKEIEALQQAKAILSGAKLNAFLQQRI